MTDPAGIETIERHRPTCCIVSPPRLLYACSFRWEWPPSRWRRSARRRLQQRRRPCSCAWGPAGPVPSAPAGNLMKTPDGWNLNISRQGRIPGAGRVAHRRTDLAGVHRRRNLPRHGQRRREHEARRRNARGRLPDRLRHHPGRHRVHHLGRASRRAPAFRSSAAMRSSRSRSGSRRYRNRSRSTSSPAPSTSSRSARSRTRARTLACPSPASASRSTAARDSPSSGRTRP